MGVPLKASESGPSAPLHRVKRKEKQEMVTQALGCQSCGGVVSSEGKQDIKAWVLFPWIPGRAGSLPWDRSCLCIV